MTKAQPLGHCESCGAAHRPGERSCSFCGARLPGGGDRFDRDDAAAALLLAMEDDISNLNSPRLMVGFVLFFVALPAAYLAVRWVGGGVLESSIATVFIGLGAAVGLGMLVGVEEDRRFRRVLRPQIDAFLAEHDMQRQELLITAKATLKDSSTLRKHLDDLYAVSSSHGSHESSQTRP